MSVNIAIKMKVKYGLASLQLPVYLIGLIETLIWHIQLVHETTKGSGSVLPSSATGGATRGRAPGRRRGGGGGGGRGRGGGRGGDPETQSDGRRGASRTFSVCAGVD